MEKHFKQSRGWLRKILKIIAVLICNIIYSLCLEVYWLYYSGAVFADGSIIFATSFQRFILGDLLPILVALIAGAGIFVNALLFRKNRKKGNKEKKWIVVFVISIIILSLPAIIGLIDFAEYLIYGDELYNR